MQIFHFCQILLHFCAFYIFPSLVLGGKRCLQSESDGTDMLLLCVIYACFSSSFEICGFARSGGGGGGGGDLRHVRVQFPVCEINNNSSGLFVVLGLMLLSAFILLHSLSAGRSLYAERGTGSLQTAAAGFLYFGVLGGKNGYKEERHVRGSG